MKKNKNLIYQIKQNLALASHISLAPIKSYQGKDAVIANSRSLLGIRNGVSIYNARKSAEQLMRGLLFLISVLKEGGRVLIVNNNPELSSFLKKFIGRNYNNNEKVRSQAFLGKKTQNLSRKRNLAAPLNSGRGFFYPSSRPKQESKLYRSASGQAKVSAKQRPSSRSVFPQQGGLSNNISTSAHRWLGGTLTNWKQVHKAVSGYAYFSQRFKRLLVSKTKITPPLKLEKGRALQVKQILKENQLSQYKKRKSTFEGLVFLDESRYRLAFSKYDKPDCIFIINPYFEESILKEANRLDIPVVALTESTTDPSTIAYPIPINSLSYSQVYSILNTLYSLACCFSPK